MTTIRRFFKMGPLAVLLAALSGCMTQATVIRIQVAPDTLLVSVGASGDLSAIGTFTDGSKRDISTEVRWQSSNPLVAAVAVKSGLVTAIFPGTVTITATGGGLSGQGTVTVPNPITSIQIALSATTLPSGMSESATATAVYTDNSQQTNPTLFVWSSSDPTVASVSSATGQIHAIKAGTVTITALDPASKVQGIATLTVSDARLTSISIAASMNSAPLGTSIQFTATGSFSDGVPRNITELVNWTASAAFSTTPGSSLGLLTPHASGAFNVFATDPNSAVQGHLNYTVSPAVVTSIDISGPASTALGFPVTFTAQGHFSDGSTSALTGLSWASSNTGAASFQASKLTPHLVASGLTLTATDLTTGVFAQTTFDVTNAILQSIVIDAGTGELSALSTQQLTATGIYSDGTQPDITTAVTWSNDLQLAALVSTVAPTQGLLSALAPGTAQITAAMPGTTISATVQITVDP